MQFLVHARCDSKRDVSKCAVGVAAVECEVAGESSLIEIIELADVVNNSVDLYVVGHTLKHDRGQ